MALFKTLRSKILATFLGSLLVVPLVTVSIFTVVVVQFSQESANDSADVMRQVELANLDHRAAAKAALVNESFNQVESDMELFASYAEDLFNGRMPVSQVPSYHGNTSLDPQSPPDFPVYDEVNERNVSYEASAWYLPGLSNLSELNDTTRELVNLSSNLDDIFMTLWKSNPAYSNIYMGFKTGGEDGGFFRIYPYKRLDHYTNKTQMNKLTCVLPPQNKMEIYDPLCRSWYQNAVTKDGLVFTAYLDASGLGLLVSASMPIMVDGELYGVVAVDLTIKAVEDAVLGTKVLDHGYAYIVDFPPELPPVAVIHPDIDRNETDQPIEDLEFGYNNTNSKFQVYLDAMESGEQGSGSFSKDGETWYLSFVPIENTSFSMVLVATEEDILRPSNEIHSEILSTLYKQLALFLLVILGVLGLIFGFAFYTSRRIVRPVEELTEITELIASGKLDRKLTGGGTGSKEIRLLYSNFQGLITGLCCGNDDYYAGKIDQAQKNYQAGLELFTTLNNEKGISICYNNLGNIHWAQGDIEEAKTFYEKAIEIGKRLLESVDDKSKPRLVAALASRYNNLGLLYMDQENYEEAEKYLQKALDFNREIDNIRGLATCYGNLGQLYLKMDFDTEAKEVFEEGFSIAEASKSDRAKAYATLNMGLWERTKGNSDRAVKYFNQAVDLAQNLDLRVVRSSLMNLREIHAQRGNRDDLSRVRQQLLQFRIDMPEEIEPIHRMLLQVEVEGIVSEY